MEVIFQFLRFIFFLGFIYITFDIIWGLIRFLLRITLGVGSENRITFHIFKIFSYFVLVTLTAVITLQNIDFSIQLYERLMFYGLGFLVLYFYITSRMQKSKLKAAIKMDKRKLQQLRYNSIYLFACLAFYIISINVPELVQNQLTDWFYNTIFEIYEVGLLRFIIGFFAVIFLINVLYQGFLGTRFLIHQLLGIESKASHAYESSFGKEDHELEGGKDGEYIDYEEVEDEGLEKKDKEA